MSRVFDKFYFKPKQTILSIDSLINASQSYDENIAPFINNMFCPECLQAQLTFYHETSKHKAYLKRIPSSSHAPNCSYNYKYAFNSSIKKYITSLSSNQVEDKLNSILHLLTRKNITSNTSTNYSKTNSNNHKNPLLVYNIDNSVSGALPQKKVNSYLDPNIIGNDIYLFYGENIKIKQNIIDKNNKKFYLLEFKAKNKNQEWTSRFKIFRNTIRDIIDENAEYYIATIGTLNLNYSKLQISPLLPNALKIKLIPK